MKKPTIAFIASCVLMTSCKKKDSDPSPSAPASPYYFKGNIKGADRNYTADIPQYMPFYANEAGGYQVADASLWPAFGLRLIWPADDTVTETDLVGLVGKTLRYDDTAVHPEVTWGAAAAEDPWTSTPLSSGGYGVTITGVTFLKKDTTAGVPIKAYVITGTCSASMSQGSAVSILSGGAFHFVISRRDF